MAEEFVRFDDGVRHLFIPGLNEISCLRDSGLRSWLATSSSFIPKQFVNDSLFELIVYSFEEPLESLASDINRLSCATLETLNSICTSEHNDKAIAWNLVKYYYSAFYSAHCLMKELGFGLIQIDEQIIRNIKLRCRAIGLSEPILKSGIYCVDFSFHDQVLRFYKIKRYDDSHRGLWHRFSDFLGVLEGVLVCSGSYDSNCIRIKAPSEPVPYSLFSYLPSEDANILASTVGSIRTLLNFRGDYNWLSFIRNTINYSHGLGAWYPYKELTKNYKKAVELKGAFRLSILSPALPKISFKAN